MNKRYIFLASILCLAPLAQAQHLTENTDNRITVSYTLPDVKLQEEGKYTLVDLSGSYPGGAIGSPTLPVFNSLLAVPFCDGIEVTVENARYDTVPLGEYDVMPRQPAYFKRDTAKHEFIVDQKTYSANSFYSLPLAAVEPMGIARDMNYALLSFAPVSVNHVSRQLVVCRSADVVVRFLNADADRTAEYYKRYHSPAFSIGSTLNTLSVTKGVDASTTPLRMVILAPASLQGDALIQFAKWKRTQGLRVDIVTPTSTTAATIANVLKEMYSGATEENPAPTYVLLIGDHEQLPAHKSKVQSSGWWDSSNDHITDLYYTTWTVGDNIPDCYIGRLSATNTATLTSIIDKTLYYEKYLFEDDSYLARAALIAGVDQGSPSDNAYRYGDPNMDYAAYYYINSDNGFNTVKYYKNNVNHYPTGVVVTGCSQDEGVADSLINYYNTGVGFINYTAHGDWNCWHEPSFTVSHANSMSNYNQPSFMIGNCCLSCQFNKGICLGEALLRRTERAGAVAYIGGTNSTLWPDDFSWSVGIRSNVRNNMLPQYNANAMGAYDHLFHTHGEALEQHAVTVSQFLVQGNMSVQNSTSSDKLYYWEIYELLGDPSLLPWLGRAAQLQVTADWNDPHKLVVHAVPGAYVALRCVDSLEATSAAFADASGSVTLPLPSDTPIGRVEVAVTAQGYQPFNKVCDSTFMGIYEHIQGETVLYPNPASHHCTVAAEGLEHVSLMNTVGQTLRSERAVNGQCTLSLIGIPAGLYLLHAQSASGSTTQKLIVR